ncbi:hypothetical protein BSR29_00690 [Boudabousia liubingyangii]|uniref:DAGKc domain-containing protein n=1 Tax=Boudabousia liubingyangii TaxID=1921764 RepID=A0A1Q5PPJ1_9ACTO|nr:diacylglycerol kinase family protein [Boudabousia liubingyangii]OKL49511.1 hypothetical protein BSR29_00690 [Boudabousia liubingyangii]
MAASTALLWSVPLIGAGALSGVLAYAKAKVLGPENPISLSFATGHLNVARVIYNPVKISDLDRFQAVCKEAAQRNKFDRVEFVPTTEDEPGSTQAAAAVSEGVDRVIAAGGDGTVRLVAGALAGTEVEFGILPLGTGNLYARNVKIPIDNLEASAQVAFGRQISARDIAWLEASDQDTAQDGPHDLPSRPDLVAPMADGRHPFLVISGLGFDAQMMADTDTRWKEKIGWGAYVAAGVKHAFDDRLHVTLSVDDGQTVRKLSVKSLFFANCGRLPGGANLVPDALSDDGLLDICAMDVQKGVIGWAALGFQVLAQNFGRKGNANKLQPGGLSFLQGKKVQTSTKVARPVQVDGDPIGSYRRLSITVDPGALKVACPAEDRS